MYSTAYALGQMERQAGEDRLAGNQGSDKYALQTLTVGALIGGAAFGIHLMGWLQLPFWAGFIIWAMATHLAYAGLGRLPGAVRSTLMGLLTGAVATTLASFELDIWRTAGTGFVTAVIVYLLFYRLN